MRRSDPNICPGGSPEAALAVPSSQFRIGSVPYLNAVPLTFGIGRDCLFLPPSRLAAELHAGRLDAALLSVTEALFHDGYDVLDGAAIASHGPVASVFLAHRDPLTKLREVHLDGASCTSVNLLRVLLAERGLAPGFRPLPDYSTVADHRNVLLIGNPALDFRRGSPAHALWDLGEAWRELAGLPFVYAVWMLRRDTPPELREHLRAARRAGLAALPEIVAARSEYDLEFRRRYLGGHIRYELGAAEKSGLEDFARRLRKYAGRPVFPVRYV